MPMTANDAIQNSLTSTQWILKQLLNDFTDAELLVRPVPGANHTAWQLGHLIAAEHGMLLSQFPQAKLPPLPAGFSEDHSKDTAKSDDPKKFLTKDGYLDLFDKVRAGTLTALKGLSDADFDKATEGKMASWCPTLGSFITLLANHTLMHAGQFTTVRRKLGKPIVM
jgi:hypothetical protein